MSALRLPFDQLFHIASENSDKVFMRQPENGQWRNLTFAETERQVRLIASALLDKGLEPGDKVAIFAKNSAEWLIADLAIALAGLVSVPIFSAADRDTIQYIIEHSEAKAAFVGKLDNFQHYEGAFADETLTIGFPYETISTNLQWNDLLDNTQIREQFPDVTHEDIMTIIYTSGSTGRPKGVVHDFNNYIHGGLNYTNKIHESYGLIPQERYLSYLPLAHITERVVGESVWLYCYNVGTVVEISFVESLATFAANLKDTTPTLFVSVPRLWQKFQSGVLAKMPQKKLNLLLSIPILSGIIKKKIREQLGFSETRMYGSGSAPIAPSLLAWYESIGVKIGQAWGMTETSACGTSQMPYRSEKRESIGYVLPGMDVRIGEEKEIQIKGNCMFKEYYKRPELNESEFTEDGYFKTGDQGEIDSEGYISIIGRLKDIFKTDKGKYVAPAPIEAVLAKCTLLEQICVVGSNLPQPRVLTVLSEEAQTLEKAEIEEQLEALLNEMNSELESHEKLDGMILLKDAWTVENGLITPTLKIKRQVIEKRLEAVYTKSLTGKITWE